MTQNYAYTAKRTRSQLRIVTDPLVREILSGDRSAEGVQSDDNAGWGAVGMLLEKGLLEAHVFHADDATARALLRTANAPRPREPLPFKDVFLDAPHLRAGPYWLRGVHVLGPGDRDGEGPPARADGPPDPGAAGPAKMYECVYHLANPGPDGVVLVRQIVGFFGAGSKYLHRVEDGRLVPVTRAREDADARLVHAACEALIQNFLDLVNDPDVRVVETPRSPERDRRFRREHGVPAPPSMRRIVLTGELKRHVDAHRAQLEADAADGGGKRRFSHRFWVRGHWRHLQSERYKSMRGRRVWVPPHVKGGGVLVRKQYALEAADAAPDAAASAPAGGGSP